MIEKKSDLVDIKDKKELTTRFGLPERFIWQLLLAWCLMLVFSATLSFFLEGKSAYDLGFTLWDDRFAKLDLGELGVIILPQIIFYGAFFLLTGFILVLVVKPHTIRRVTLIVLFTTGIFLLYFIANYGIVLQTYLGGRQGPAGWLLLELPQISLILFCLTFALGLIGLWLVAFPEIPISNEIRKNGSKIKDWLLWSSLVGIRTLIIIGLIVGSVALNAILVLVFNNVNAVLIVGACACVASLGIILFKKDVFSDYIEKKEVVKGSRKEAPNGKGFQFFTISDLKEQEEGARCGDFAFTVNPRNRVWRVLRNILNGLLTALVLGLMIAMCFMTVPDEWVFLRFFELLPWTLLGILMGILLMSFLPEPAIYYPFTLYHIIITYDSFLVDYSFPFSPGFVVINSLFLGFWISVLIASQNYANRARGKGRNLYSMVFTTFAFFMGFLMVTLVDRFQHKGQMVQKVITEVLDVLVPTLLDFSLVFLIITGAFWGIDLLYRHKYLRNKPVFLRVEPVALKRMVHRFLSSIREKIVKRKVNISQKNKKIISLALIGIFIGAFITVEVSFVNANHVRPLLARNDNFGIWTVSGVTKVEKRFPIQMPVGAPVESSVEVSAARGEWEGWHILISPQPGKTVELTDVQWTDFTRAQSSELISSDVAEAFLVGYLIDEQPDTLMELPDAIARSAGEHIDLFCRLQVPRDAIAGTYNGQLSLTINNNDYKVNISLRIFDFTMPKDRHLRHSFGGGWYTEQWYDELEYLRITQQNMGIPFKEGAQYWWNATLQKFEFDWSAYDTAFQAQLNRGFTGIRQGYFPDRPSNITNDAKWANIERWFLSNVSAHLESHTWKDELGDSHSWVEIPYNYWTDEPGVSEYEGIKERNDRYHAGSPLLRTLLTEEYREEYPVLHDCIDIWCPLIGNFEPSAVENRHAAGQEYWTYVCVAPTSSYPNFQLWESGHSPRLLPIICARFNLDGFLYWRINAGNNTYRAGFDGNGDGQIAFEDPRTGRPLPSLRMLSYSAGVEDFEYIWLMRATLENQATVGMITSGLLSRAANIESRLEQLVGERAQFVNYDLSLLLDLREDLALLLEDLWPYAQKLYSQ